MRRRHEQIDDPATLERWLADAVVGRLATIDENGYPVIKPVNFVYADGKILFHSAAEGEKLDDIRRNDKVGFEIDKVLAITPPLEVGCQTHCLFESVIIRGRARILDGTTEREAKERALHLLVKKYAPAMAETRLKWVDQAAVVEISIEQITGKEDLGQNWTPERKLTVAKMLYERDGPAAGLAIARLGVSIEEVAERSQGRKGP